MYVCVFNGEVIVKLKRFIMYDAVIKYTMMYVACKRTFMILSGP